MTALEFKQDTVELKKPTAAISVKNVLYATDFSAASESALPYAAAVCRKLGSTLHVAHVLSDTAPLLMSGGIDYIAMVDLCENANTLALEQLQKVIAPVCEIPHRTYVRHGSVWPNLSRIISESEIDLIVIGSHGRTGLGKLLLGSVAENILRHSPCPVLTVGPKVCGRARLPKFDGNGRALAPPELELRHILYATNFTSESLQVAPLAVGLAKQFDGRLTLMHVIENYSNLEERSGPIESGLAQLAAVVPKDAGLAYAPEPLVEFGPAWECIVKTAAKHDADLIVLGARPSDSTSHVPWSTVHRVVANARCPILTVRAQRHV